jgi:hypothetical protein
MRRGYRSYCRTAFQFRRPLGLYGLALGHERGSTEQRTKQMPAKTHAASATSFYFRPGRGMDEALKAGIGATVCSVFILAAVLLAMHALPVGIG